MSLIIFKELSASKKKAQDLEVGTWFTDFDSQVCVVAMDDRTFERRVVCTGNIHSPFISNVSTNKFELKQVIAPGTLLQVSTTLSGGNHE